MSVIVFGSINMDLVTKTPRLPVPGETLLGHNFTTVPGGKGANQAVAVAHLGVPTSMVGRVGNDNFGHELINNLQAVGVDTHSVLLDHATVSGVAVIAVDDTGENHIIVVPGANGQVDQTDVTRLENAISSVTSILLLQLEIPLSAVVAAAQTAQKAGVKVILDPAPAQIELPDDLYPLIDIITPNQVEAGQLVGFPIDGVEAASKAAIVLRQRGANTVIIKLGQQGTLCMSAAETFVTPAFSVKVVDTVAAGDAFNGGLAAALAEGLPLPKAVIWGTATAALSVTKAGAQPSMPDRNTFNTFLQAQSL